ncbi:toxin-antitoxin system HicB family antitoxin [Leptospira sp. GIMC2001]|uniref:toxin-antitoxin system HicB family antitoxin n=1 Tax=Leptospira sp. GIMC2001 TaxID=1513297 RepID=UPI00234A71DB|nr:toxin-antitoxin system HicB family antitoxin [Leptospira sp. GIMC2001]WCL50787.1 toxin-antitoxin system HicB family antitoxin [Leptospira sp. GIMC2001]
MKAKASLLTLRIPSELKHKIERLADEQGVSINQLALYAFTKEVKELETRSYFEQYYKGKSKKEIFSGVKEVLNKLNHEGDIPEWDRL